MADTINKSIAKSLNNLNTRVNAIIEGKVVALQFIYDEETKVLNITGNDECLVYDSETKILNIMI